ncbi:ABC transporter ATP-binding protein [Acidisphaera sp. L21]|uniref:ABC transporter ATP-binding protein n=1 Tax=Acidisphaera sp. L21 TaxID=1641851 RepID=UPI00131CD2AC|nr:oligopeptide/dipeptide ABC transporter ATP-binding protein [Acidisphaera sp. L21]
MTAPLIRADGLTKHYPIVSGTFRRRVTGAVRAVDGVSFTIRRGETLALVGESGCGKSTTGRLLMRLVEPSSGTVRFDGTEISELDARQLRTARRRMQLIFQDPGSSFNPRMSVAALIAEPMRLAGVAGSARRVRVQELLPLVGLAAEHANRYPHEFSGGQRQRIGIARALALRPDFVVCDEPVSALDVSVQAQVINLLTDLQRDFGLTYLFISHDLRVVRHVADRVAVMYLGRIVELADKQALYQTPQHPYTRALLSAVPAHRPGAVRARIEALGEIASARAVPPGCRYHTRCPAVMPVCRTDDPALTDLGGGHLSACHLTRPAH